MQTQTLTQTITILVGDTTSGMLAETGISLAAFIGVGVTLILSAILLYRFATRRGLLRSISSFRNLGIFAFLALGLISLALNLSTVSAAPTLTLAANQSNLNITIPKGGGKAATTTTMTTSTANATGYTLTASLEAEEPGIGISLKGGTITTSTPLVAGAIPLSLKTTSTANTNDTTTVELSFTIDGTVTEGTKELKLVYAAVDNEAAEPVTPPLTMQTMTQNYCQNHMAIYDGTNEDAVLTLEDTRGGTTQHYQVAKLADNNCWMLDNLKVGSTTGTITLTSADSNVSSNFTLPQLNDGTRDIIWPDDPGNDLDTPYVYGPVPGDAGSGATNYGYLYNWSAATAGETRDSMPEDSGDAAYSICPANWRLPTGGVDMDTWTPLATDEFNILSANLAGFASGQDPDYLANHWEYYQGWQYDGPLKGTTAGWWRGSFEGQGLIGTLWSRSSYPSYLNNAFFASFYFDGTVGGVYQYENSSRLVGRTLRCLLNQATTSEEGVL